MFALYLIDHSRFMIPWLVPLFILNLAVMWVQIVLQTTLLMGISGGPNTTAALLVLGAIFCLSRKEWRWLLLAAPLVLSVPFTGSRSAMLAMGALLPGLAIRARISAKVWVAALLIGLIILTIGIEGRFWNPDGNIWFDRVGSKLSTSPSNWLNDVNHRLFGLTPYWPSFEPVGFLPEVDPHNIPLRLSVTTGIASALAWVAVTIYGLWEKPRFDTSWWLLFGVLSLSMLDWYFWQLCLMAFWWILISIRTKGTGSRDIRQSSHSHKISSARELSQSTPMDPEAIAR